jgi:hypothetical protein
MEPYRDPRQQLRSGRVAIVCGGLDFVDRTVLFQVLDTVHASTPLVHLFHGGARGADSLAEQWARARGISSTIFPADWNRFGAAANGVRDQRMADAGPDLCIAFPGGQGTEDMVCRARRAGVQVLRADLSGRLHTASGPEPRARGEATRPACPR